MAQKRHDIVKTVHGVKTVVRSFGFTSEDGSPVAVPNQHIPAGENQKDLVNCFIGWVGKSAVIRSGSIDSSLKAAQFLAAARCARNAEKPLRVCSNQINSIEKEWDEIGLQHQHLIELRNSLKEEQTVIHICDWMDNLYTDIPPEHWAAGRQRAIHELLKLLNMEAWISYCGWFNQVLQKAFSQFKYDAVDEYTIERYIVDFNHEVHNVYLSRVKEKLIRLELAIGTQERSTEIAHHKLVQLEKDLILAREDMKRMARAHYDNLQEITQIIAMIEERHPDLIPVRQTGELLEALMAVEVDASELEILPFGLQEILIQLLNDELGVVSAINSEHGIDRTSAAFALRLAILQLKSNSSTEEAIDLAVNWLETVQKVHQCLAKRGVEGLDKWVSQIQSSDFRKRVKRLFQFWELFLKNMHRICRTITGWNRKEGQQPSREGLYLNQEVLQFFPPFIKEGENYRMLVEYDRKTEQPSNLTEEGHSILLESCSVLQ